MSKTPAPPPKKPAKPKPRGKVTPAAAAEAAALLGRLADPKADSGCDMERLEADYRAGVLTLRDMGEKHGMSHTMVAKHAKAGGWTQDLKAKIRAKADEMMNIVLATGATTAPESIAKRAQAEVDKTVSMETADVVFGSAQAHVSMKLRHMGDIKRLRALALRMIGELESVTDAIPDLEQLREALASSDDVFAMAAAANLEAIIAAGGRTKPFKDLVAIVQTLIALEREAYGIAPVRVNEEPPAPPPAASADPAESYRWMLSQKVRQ